MTLKNKIVVGGATLALSAGAFAGSATARIDQDGLVNVALEDTTVQVPIAVAANICGVAVNLLATGLNVDDVDCTASAEGVAEALEVSQGDGGGGNTRQNGLVNVALSDTTIQVPIAIAANICGVGIGVLANFSNAGGVDCTAEGNSLARE